MTKQQIAVTNALRRGYIACEEGKVYSPYNNELKFSYAGSGGYPKFTIRLNGERVSIMVYNLVAYQKYGVVTFKRGVQVRHLDGNPRNTSYGNIALGSQSQNQMDIPIEIRKERSLEAAKKTRKLTEKQVQNLRFDRDNGFTYSMLMDKYRIAKSTVSYIVNRKTYSWV